MALKRSLSYVLSLIILLTPMVGSVQAQSLTDAEPVVEKANMTSETDLAESLATLPGAGDDWWSTVQEDIRQSEYQVTWQEHTYLSDLSTASQAPNRAHNLRTYFTPESIRVIPRAFEGETSPWEWGLSLTSYGTARDTQSVAAATLAAINNRIEYQRCILTEWYVNDERGLERGFTLYRPPASLSGDGMGDWIALDLTMTGILTSQLANAGDGIEFTNMNGVTALRNSDLIVTDAAGRQLPSRLKLPAPDFLRITYDAAGALYPITVDPLATTPAWIAESDQDYAYFGYSVGTAWDVNGDGYSDVIVEAINC